MDDLQYLNHQFRNFQLLTAVKKLQFRIAVIYALKTTLLPSLHILYLNTPFHISCPSYHPLNKNQSYLFYSQSTLLPASSHLQTAHDACSSDNC